MPIVTYRPTTPSRRFMTRLDFKEITRKKPIKALTEKMSKTGAGTIRDGSRAVGSGRGTSAVIA